LSEVKLEYLDPTSPELDWQALEQANAANAQVVNLDAPATATQGWSENLIQSMLSLFNLSPETGLSVPR